MTAGPATVTSPALRVVAALLLRGDGRVLISQRPAGRAQAGAWEFPGGKLEAGEGRLVGLARELEEELGVTPERARALIRFNWCYPQARVDLDFWLVTRWRGSPRSLEAQAFTWLAPRQLADLPLLAANHALAQALWLQGLRLPWRRRRPAPPAPARLRTVAAGGAAYVYVDGAANPRAGRAQLRRWLAAARAAGQVSLLATGRGRRAARVQPLEGIASGWDGVLQAGYRRGHAGLHLAAQPGRAPARLEVRLCEHSQARLPGTPWRALRRGEALSLCRRSPRNAFPRSGPIPSRG